MISKNKVPDGGGENRRMFQLFLISHFLAVVKNETHPLKDTIVTSNVRGSWSGHSQDSESSNKNGFCACTVLWYICVCICECACIMCV